MSDHLNWADVVFYLILFVILCGAFDRFSDIIKLFINRHYDAKIAQADAVKKDDAE